ncbi:MAG: cytochrome C [Nitrospirota bacterium]
MLRVAIKILVISFFFIVMTGYSIAAEKGVVTYEKDIKKITSEKCIFCHGSDSPTIDEFDKDKEGFKKKMKGPRMETYQNLMIFVNGKDAGAVMRRLDDGKNTKDGKPGNMYQFLGNTDNERAKNFEVFKKWVGNWTLKKKKELTEDELKTIKAIEK